MPVPDLLPMMRRAGSMTERLDEWGFISQLRPNHLIAPTSNVGVRRAMMAAISQRDVMEALMGGDPDGWMVPVGYLITGKPEVDQAGIENVSKPHSVDQVKAMLDKAGYNGERLVLLHTTDQPFHAASSTVVADALTRVGMRIDDQSGIVNGTRFGTDATVGRFRLCSLCCCQRACQQCKGKQSDCHSHGPRSWGQVADFTAERKIAPSA